MAPLLWFPWEGMGEAVFAADKAGHAENPDHLTVSVKSSKGFLNSVQDFQHGQPCQQQIETIYFLPFWSVRFFLALPVLSSSLCFVFTRTPRTVLTRSAYRRRHALFLVLLGKCSILTHNTSSTFFEALRLLL